MDDPNTPRFVHLHLHSEYSLLDGANRIGKLIDHVKQLGMDAVAVTDHGNLHGAAELYTKATAAGIKPILGIEAYVAAGDRREKGSTGIAEGAHHLVLLAENDLGWHNLIKLSSDSFLNGFYYRPRMDKSTLSEWADGIIAINGHLGSSLAAHLQQYAQTNNEAHFEAALEEARWHAHTFKPNEAGEPRFYVELQRHETPEQDRINPSLIRLARELDLPLVADNDAHFLSAQDHDVHDTLCCISMARTKDDTGRLQYSRQLYVKSPQQMAELFADVPEAIENTVRIAARCNVDLDFSASHTPVVKIARVASAESRGAHVGDAAEGSTEWYKRFCAAYDLEPFDSLADDTPADELASQCDQALRDLCEAGLVWRYGTDGISEDIRNRLNRELQILADKNISAYFLIVWDFVNWARQRGIPAMARGSGVGTMVGYAMGLSNACPIRYGLLFERFTDPDRSEYPDIDIDICQNGRGEVIDYVRNKYGHVAQIITFGRLKAKAAIKDVARVMGLSPREGQQLSNHIPSELNITIDAALAKEPDFKAAYDNEPQTKRVIDAAKELEGHARHAGVHAAGVVIATQPLDNIVPLYRPSGSEDVVTQWDGPTCERVGLLKMDFLGLRTLSTIERACDLIRSTLPEEAIWDAVGRPISADRSTATEAGPHPLDLDRLEYNDPRVLELFARGDTAGIFQFESGGMRRLLMEMKPDRLEDLIAANALYRPGPMDLIPEYNLRKHGKQPVPQVHPIVDGFTSETYGIMVYQEQVMQIVHGLGDIPLRAAYTLIKAISKKKSAVINAERPKFINGASEKGLSKKQANDLFDLILKFAGYGFNKSHSTGYAIVAYQTAYLKTYFPNQYMAALLTFESDARKVEDWVPYLEDCKQTRFPDHTQAQPHVGVEVRPPDVNLSEVDFSVVFVEDEPHDTLHGHVRFGLNAIRGAAEAGIRAIVEQRRTNGLFKSIYDFCERVDLRAVTKPTIEALVKAAAFDSIHGRENRSAVFAAIADAMSSGQSAAEDRRSGQMNIFGAAEEDVSSTSHGIERPLPTAPAWEKPQALAFEKDALGFHVSGHPLDEYNRALSRYCTCGMKDVADLRDDAPVVLGGMLAQVRTRIVQRGRSQGQKMAIASLQDKTGSVEIVIFSDVYAKHMAVIHNDSIIAVTGKVDRSRGDLNVVVEKMIPIDELPSHFSSRVDLHLDPGDDPQAFARTMHDLDDVLRNRRGDNPAGDRVSDPPHAAEDQNDSPNGGNGAARGNGSAAGDTRANGNNGHGGGRPVEVMLHLYCDKQRISLRPNNLRVIPQPGMLESLRGMLGPDRVKLIAQRR